MLVVMNRHATIFMKCCFNVKRCKFVLKRVKNGLAHARFLVFLILLVKN